ncbi:MAG: AraC family transcriptional regulator [Clostridia bacterium]|nr:AraC family transcriptional regulator [Clostridia bacterium]
MESLKISFGGYRIDLTINPELKQHMKQWGIKRHCHAKYEAHIILSGECRMDIEEISCRLTEGDVLLISPGQYHCTTVASEDFSHFVLSFVLKETPSQSSFAERTQPCVLGRMPDYTLSLCRYTHTEMFEKRLFRTEALHAQYAMLLTEVFRAVLSSKDSEIRTASKTIDARYVLIDNYFEKHLTTESSIEQMAEELHLSPRQISRILKTSYGVNFREKLRRTRMDRAGWLLRTTELSVREISEQVGYNSETSFFKAFKSNYGMTPHAYRKAKKK